MHSARSSSTLAMGPGRCCVAASWAWHVETGPFAEGQGPAGQWLWAKGGSVLDGGLVGSGADSGGSRVVQDGEVARLGGRGCSLGCGCGTTVGTAATRYSSHPWKEGEGDTRWIGSACDAARQSPFSGPSSLGRVALLRSEPGWASISVF